MKKVLSVLVALMLLISANSVSAKTIKVIGKTLNDFSTIEKTENLKVEILGTHKTPTGNYIPAGTIISGKMVKFVEPKRAKRDAHAYLKINNYKLAHENTYRQVINPNAVAKISKYQKLDIKDKSIDLGTTAAGFFVENISYPINFVRGAVGAQEGENRLKAGAKKTYEKSFFSYASRGKELVVPSGSLLTVSFTFGTEQDENDD